LDKQRVESTCTPEDLERAKNEDGVFLLIDRKTAEKE